MVPRVMATVVPLTRRWPNPTSPSIECERCWSAEAGSGRPRKWYRDNQSSVGWSVMSHVISIDGSAVGFVCTWRPVWGLVLSSVVSPVAVVVCSSLVMVMMSGPRVHSPGIRKAGRAMRSGAAMRVGRPCCR